MNILCPVHMTTESHVGRASSSNIGGNITPNLEVFSTSFSEAHKTHEYRRSSSPMVPEFPNVEDELAPIAYSIPTYGGIVITFPKLPRNAEEEFTQSMLYQFLSNMVSGTSPVPNSTIETRHAKIDKKPKYCTRAPFAVLEARENNFCIPACKSIWILHPLHVNIAVAAGKTGVS